LDRDTKVAENTTVDGYFCVCTVDGEYITIYGSANEYPVNYNSSTRVLDFSGTVEGRTALVGVVGFDKSTGKYGGVFTDLYANAKLTLTSTSSAPQFSGEVVLRAGDIGLKKYKVREASILERTNSNTGFSGKKYLINKEHLKELKTK
jgi:hypothetical protein